MPPISSAHEREETSMRTIAAVMLLLLAPLTAFAQAKPGGKIVFAAREDIARRGPRVPRSVRRRRRRRRSYGARPAQAAVRAVPPDGGAVAAGAAVADGRAEDGTGLLAQARRHRPLHGEGVDPQESRDAGA